MRKYKTNQNSWKHRNRIPAVFECPACAERSIRIQLSKAVGNKIAVRCGCCGLELRLNINKQSEPIDVFGDFIDLYFGQRTKKAETLNSIDKGFLEF